uniref:Glycoside hydrolase family 28 n=1 Tax=Ramulus artemis TaxID=1390046 RepID=A0A191XT50_9NEOP|nr:glycoside hydrolase family 28 [Ramulus artemis]
MKQSFSLLFFTAWALLHTGSGRDLRTVTEPKNPPICTTLKPSSADETKMIQNALHSCAKGKAVALSSGVFTSGSLVIPSGVSLLIDKGATLRASTNPKLFDRGTNTCGTVDNSGGGCKPLIAISGATGSGVYGKGTIDGGGNSKLTGSSMTWWDLSSKALAENKAQNNPKMILINNSRDITLYQITVINSPYFHIQSRQTFGFTVWGVTINTPSSTRNTDGIDPTGSMNVTIAHCSISTGDDNIAISSQYAASKYISVFNNHFGHGSSMGIGSGTTFGVSDVTVTNLTMDNIRFGLYIKSNTENGGLVTNVTYNNVCIYDSPKPIVVDMHIARNPKNHTPEFNNIYFNNINVLTKGNFVFRGISKSNMVQVALKNVHIIKGSKWSVTNAKIDGTWTEDASSKSCTNPASEYLINNKNNFDLST